MQAAILAGGPGTRLGKITQKTPKVLIKIGDKTILEHQLTLLKKSGIKDIWILSGYLGKKIETFLKDNNLSLKINLLNEETPLGTAGAIKTLEGKITEDFLLLSGDVMLDIDVESFVNFHKNAGNPTVSIIVHPNDHPFDSDLVEINRNYRVTKFKNRKNKTHPKNLLYQNLTNTGIFILSPKIFKYINTGQKTDLEKDIFPKIISSKGKIYAYKSPEYIKDMGTPQRFKEVIRDHLSGKIQRLNKKNSRKAIFIDRDGTINTLVRDLSDIHDFKLLLGSADAISKINQSEYLAIIITNQPQLAKGMLSASQLEKIHKKLETELGNQGAKIDAIYFCPHHPETGFEGEVKSLKINCSCRKPKIGLIKKAVKDFNIDLKKSFMIGDSTTDAKTAQNAKMQFIGVETGYGLKDKNFKILKPQMAPDLHSAVEYILKHHKLLTKPSLSK